MKIINILAALVLGSCTLSALSEEAVKSNPQDKNFDKPERGWWFFEGPPKKKEEPAPTPQMPPPLTDKEPPPPTDKKCTTMATWSAECGFVNPGTNFEFQAKQRDALMERMVISQNDPKAVENFQYYMRWVMERTSEVSNLWYYNMTQNPELDPSSKNPISAFGLRLMTDVQKGKEAEVAKLLAEEGAALIYFSRSDCMFCHQMSHSIRDLGKELKIQVLNASLDDKCMPGFEEGCSTQKDSLAAAQALQVVTVPTVFLYVPKNTWIRISTGVSDSESMKARAMQFFIAYRTALLKGVTNSTDGRASVDFSKNDDFMAGSSTGVEKSAAPAKLPTEADLAGMVGKPTAKP